MIVVSCRIWVILSQSDWDLVGLVSKRNLLKLLKGILWQSLADTDPVDRTKLPTASKASNPWTVQWCRQYYRSLMGNYDKLVMSLGPSSECSAMWSNVNQSASWIADFGKNFIQPKARNRRKSGSRWLLRLAWSRTRRATDVFMNANSMNCQAQ